MMHNSNGPACISYENSQTKRAEIVEYYKHGIMHRLDRPAGLYQWNAKDTPTLVYAINGINYTKDQFDAIIAADAIDNISDLNPLDGLF